METQSDKLLETSFSNNVSVLDEAIATFVPENDNRYYRGRKLIATGWCDLYLVKTNTNCLNKNLVNKLERHYLRNSEQFEYVNIHIGLNGCLVAYFYILMNDECALKEKESLDLTEGDTAIGLTGIINTGILDTDDAFYLIREYCRNGANSLTKLQKAEGDTAIELIGIINANIPDTTDRFSEKHITTPREGRDINRSITKAIADFFNETKGIGVTISVNTNTDIINMFVGRYKEFTNKKEIDQEMDPIFILIGAVNNIIPKIDGPFAEITAKVQMDTTRLRDSDIEGVVAFYLAKHNIKASILVYRDFGVVSVSIHRSSITPVKMPPEDRFFYEVVDCMDARIKCLKSNNSNVQTVCAAFDMAFFGGYLPDAEAGSRMQLRLARKYFLDGWPNASVSFDINTNVLAELPPVVHITLRLNTVSEEVTTESMANTANFDLDAALCKVDILKTYISVTRSALTVGLINKKIDSITCSILNNIDIEAYTDTSSIASLIDKLKWLSDACVERQPMILLIIDDLILRLINTIA